MPICLNFPEAKGVFWNQINNISVWWSFKTQLLNVKGNARSQKVALQNLFQKPMHVYKYYRWTLCSVTKLLFTFYWKPNQNQLMNKKNQSLVVIVWTPSLWAIIQTKGAMMKSKPVEERLWDKSRGMSSLNSISTPQKQDSLSPDLSPSGIFFGFAKISLFFIMIFLSSHSFPFDEVIV